LPRTTGPGRSAYVADAAGFAGLGIPKSLVAALSRAGIERPTTIQAAAVPDALAGRDVLGRAPTGSGKTLAYGLPMIARLGETGGTVARPNRAGRRPRGLVLVPTRELADQVAAALVPLAGVGSLRVLVVVGGAPIGRQISTLRRGVDIVVATPGRLVDLLNRKEISLADVDITVLDEADHMADLGFLPAVRTILDAVPSGRQRLLFSATLDRDVDTLVRLYLTAPEVHGDAETAQSTPPMDHKIVRVSRDDKISVATDLAASAGKALIFVRTKHGADRLAKQIRSRGLHAVALHGNLNLNQRRRALEGFSRGEAPVLVATDVAARGLHVDDLELVVHFDPPNDHKTYSHRSGRTARAGAHGTVISLVEPHQSNEVARLHAAAGVASSSPGASSAPRAPRARRTRRPSARNGPAR
jgi:superfamily II DNA/RNA helicase